MFEEMKTRHLFGLTILLMVVFGIGAIFLPYSDNFVEAGITLILYIAAPLLFFRYHFRKQGQSVREVVFKEGTVEWLPRLFGFVAISIAFSISVFWLQLFALYPIFPGFVDFLLEPIPMPENPIYLVISLVSIAIIGPIAEEFIFRGVLLHRMMKKTSMWGGILISSILFGLLHADVVGAFIFGVIASLLYLKTRNLLIPILMHIINNSIAVIWMYVAPTWPKWGIMESSELYDKALPNAIVLLISSVLITWVIVSLVKSLPKKTNKEEVEEEMAQ
ncbi:CPBP family intramembrane glutamic endopeptidase [Paenisporosarcina sp. HGH0030]|uniref:CPBP family intramembrane glutamic endopeptidase n=1 Tax=Paenisporosarcina sp. HGH0030 TaxID=1078085 RepID=UPI00039A6C08|nr:type II CAAX endopeptidase family protein [Paenisporosarcina sp. HGH0030]